jgi:biotin carboxyl carrier protein
MKKAAVVIGVLVAVGISARAYYIRRGDKEPQVMTAQVTRGDIVDTVGATGTLEAVTTVQVGTQVSGTVQELYADFNSIVKKGQVIARLDPALIKTQIEQQQANVERAQAEVERLRVGLEDAKVKLQRAQDLSERSLIPKAELDAAEVAVRSSEAQLRSAQAGLTQARANLNQMKVNLDYTVIHSPIDGIVISRNVDVGQTVAASMQAPTLYLLAARPHEDEGERQHRRSRRRPDPAPASRAVPGRRLPYRGIRGIGLADPAAAGRRPERRDLRDGHRRAESRPEVEAGHDGQRVDRDLPTQQRRPRARGGAAVPTDDRYLRGARRGSAAGTAARSSRRGAIYGFRGERHAADRHAGATGVSGQRRIECFQWFQRFQWF